MALYLVQGYLLCGDIKRAVAILEQAHAESTPQADELDRMRTAVSERLRRGSSNELVDSVLLLLNSRSQEPDLGFLFIGSRPASPSPGRPAQSRRTNLQPAGAMPGPRGRGGMAVNQVTATAATAQTVARVPGRMMDDLLRHAQSRGMLDALEQAALAKWERHRGSSHLGALVTLARFAQGDVPSAAEAAGRWSTLLATQPALAGEVEAVWIAGRCLDHAKTAAFGRKLAREVAPAARARGLRPESIDLTIRMIKSAVSDGQKDDALTELQRLQDALGPRRALPMAAP